VRAAAFLDRDGVLNASVIKEGKPYPPGSISEVEILPGVLEAINLLIQNHYLPVVITNQPDVSRGMSDLQQIQLINNYIGRMIGVSDFYVCPHDDVDQCACRKPKPGLIEVSTKELGIDLSESFLVGDRWRDIEAGHAMGLHSFFIDYSYDEIRPSRPYTQVSSLLEAVETRIRINHA
jgi:D-glycero-D-manno-heptose 1,7-bisphosphate phosphatase